MEFEVDGRTVNVKEPKGKHQREYLVKASKFQKPDPKAEDIIEFLDYRDGLLAELAGMRKEEVEEIPLSTKNKILKEIESRFVVFPGSDMENSIKN